MLTYLMVNISTIVLFHRKIGKSATGFFFYGVGMVIETSFNGAGDTWTPTYLNLFVFWLFEIPFAYLLAYRFGYGPQGVFWSITVAFSLLAIASGILFKRGKWKLKVV